MRCVRIALVGLLLAATAGPAAAQDGTPPSGGDLDLVGDSASERARLRPAAGFRGLENPPGDEDLWVAWGLRRDLLEKGEAERADKKLDELLDLRLELGYDNVSPLAWALLAEAGRVLEAGDRDGALAAARAAAALAPDLPAPSFALARLHVTGGFEPASMLSEVLKGVRKSVQHPLEAHRLAGEVGLRLGAAALIVALLFIVMQLIRHGATLRHDVMDVLPRGVSPAQATVLLGVVAVAPALLGLPPAAGVVVWLVALFGYANTGERVATLVVIALFATLPLTVGSLDRFFRLHGTVAEALYLANYDVADEDVVRRLRAAAKQDPSDADVHFTLGLVQKRRGELYVAEETLKRAFEAGGERHVEALIALGNVHLGQNRLDDARAAYERAARIDSGRTAVLYDQARLAQAAGKDKDEVARLVGRAMKGDEPRVERFQQDMRMSLNRYVMDDPVPLGRLLPRLYADPGGPPVLLPFVWPRLAQGIPAERAPVLGGIVILFLILFWAIRSRLRFAGRCLLCTRPVCQRCHPGIARTGHCSICYEVFHRAERVRPRDRQVQERLVRDRRTRRRLGSLALTLTLTGSGHLFLGRTVRGVLFLGAFSFFAGLVLTWDGVLRPLSPALPGAGTGRVATAAIAFGVVYLLAILDIRVEERS